MRAIQDSPLECRIEKAECVSETVCFGEVKVPGSVFIKLGRNVSNLKSFGSKFLAPTFFIPMEFHVSIIGTF